MARKTRLIRSDLVVELNTGDKFKLPEISGHLYQSIYLVKVDSASGTALITSDVGIGDFKTYTLIGQGDFLVLIAMPQRWAIVGSTGVTGRIEPFAVNEVPAGYLWADGSKVNRKEYHRLFLTIDTTFGAGNNTTTFTLPDYRGAFLRGSGENSWAKKSNDEAIIGPDVGEFQLDQIEEHHHAMEIYKGLGEVIDIGGIRTNRRFVGKGSIGKISSAIAGVTPRYGDETRPFNSGVLYCIKI